MKKLLSMCFGVSLLLTLSCGSSSNSENETQGPAPTVEIKGTLTNRSASVTNRSASSRATTITHVLAIPLDNNHFSEARRSEIDSHGTFTLSVNARYNYVLVLANIDSDNIITRGSTLSISNGTVSSTVFPIAKLSGSSLNIGEVNATTGTTDATFSNFGIGTAAPEQIARLDGSVENIIIQYTSLDPQNPEKSLIAESCHYLIGSYTGLATDPQRATELQKYRVRVTCSKGYLFGTNDIFQAIRNGNVAFTLYADGTPVYIYDSTGSTGFYDSTCPMQATGYRQNGPHTNSFFTTTGSFVYLSDDSLEIEFCELVHSNPLPGTWIFRNSNNNAAWNSDFSIPNTLPLSSSGKALIFVPELKITTGTIGGVVDRIQTVTIKWKQYDGTAYVDVNADAMSTLIQSYDVKIANYYGSGYKEFIRVRPNGSEVSLTINCSDKEMVYDSVNPNTGVEDFLVYYKMAGQGYFFNWRKGDL